MAIIKNDKIYVTSKYSQIFLLLIILFLGIISDAKSGERCKTDVINEFKNTESSNKIGFKFSIFIVVDRLILLKKNKIIVVKTIKVAHLPAKSISLNIAIKIGIESKIHIIKVGVFVKYSLETKVENLKNVIITINKTSNDNNKLIVFEKGFGRTMFTFSIMFLSGSVLKTFKNKSKNRRPIIKTNIREYINEYLLLLIKNGKIVLRRFVSIKQIMIKEKVSALIL